MQQLNISTIFEKSELFNFGQIINHVLLPFPVFQPPFHPDNNAIWQSFQNFMFNYIIVFTWFEKCCCRFLSRSNQTAAGSVGVMSAEDQVDLEEMAAKQNRCLEMQCLLGGTSLKLAFRQTGNQRLAGDVSTDNFQPIERIQKNHF